MTIIRVIDFETTGEPDKSGEIIETGYTDVILNGTTWDIADRFHSQLFDFHANHMDPAAQAAHHLHKWELSHYSYFSTTHALSLLQCEPSTTRKVDYIAAHNAKFELDMLARYGVNQSDLPPVIDTMKVARRVYPSQESFSLQTLRYALDLEISGTPNLRHLCSPAHRAGPDTYVTALLLHRILSMFHVGPQEMVAYTQAPAFYATCPIGKFKGKPWSAVDNGYLIWIVRKAEDMDPDIKAAAQIELNGRTAPRW